MPDYKSLYHLMVNASEDALAALEKGDPAQARQILIDAELAAEDRVMEKARSAPQER